MVGKASEKAAKVAKKAATVGKKAVTRRVAKKTAKVAKKAAARRVEATAPARRTAMQSPSRQGKAAPSSSGSEQPRLLSGGNPQIGKGYGDAPVQAYIAALPGWKRDVGRQLDALIVRLVPGVHKAVKWNTPLYGVPGQGWFVGMHAFTKYLKVTFFRGTSLRPVPPGASKTQDTRYFDIRESEPFDAAQLGAWVKQASQLPGEEL